MKQLNSEELSTLSAKSRISKLGVAGFAVLVGLISIGITVFYSLSDYKNVETINASKQEKIQIINESSKRVESQSQEIRDIVNSTDDQELRDKLNEYQKNIDKLIEESRDSNELLKQDIERYRKGSSLDISVISVAYAAADDESKLRKQNVLWAILILLALVYLGALYSLLFSKSPKNIDLATDLVKTLTGFYIGIATSVVA